MPAANDQGGGETRRDGEAPAAATSAGVPDIAKLAHELRTPLGQIATFAEIMRDASLGPLTEERYRSYAADIHEAATHALSVLAGMTDPAARAGVAPRLSPAVLDLAQVIEAAVSAMRPVADRQGVRLTADMAPGLPQLVADRPCLRQILDNLMTNALRSTPPRGTVAVSARSPGQGLVTVEIADTGDGIAAADLARMNAGLAAPEHRRRRSGGTGFGIPLVHALAAANGASISFESRPGQGTRATLTFAGQRPVQA